MADNQFLDNFGNAIGQYEAAKSPLGAAVYQGMTGKTVNPQNPGMALAQSLIGRYRRDHTPGQPSQAQPTQQTLPQPDQSHYEAPAADPNAGYVHQGVSSSPQAAPSIKVSLGGNSAAGYSPSNPFGNDPFWNNDPFGGSNTSTGPGYIPANTSWDPPSWGGGYDPGLDPGYGEPGDGPYEGGAALGMVAGHPTTTRVGESGPEMAGGKLITKPTIVSLAKGEAVVPLTARPNNKLQPDLLEGHLAPPKVPGVNFSRYKAYGTGRGLMR